MSYYDTDARNSLIGVKVERFKLNADRTEMTIYGHKGKKHGWLFGQRKKPVVFLLKVESHGHSFAWIEDIFDENALIGGTIKRIEDVEFWDEPVNGNYNSVHCSPYEDCIKYYGLALWTNRGKCVVDYRNNSDGHYNVSIEVEEIVVEN